MIATSTPEHRQDVIGAVELVGTTREAHVASLRHLGHVGRGGLSQAVHDEAERTVEQVREVCK